MDTGTYVEKQWQKAIGYAEGCNRRENRLNFFGFTISMFDKPLTFSDNLADTRMVEYFITECDRIIGLADRPEDDVDTALWLEVGAKAMLAKACALRVLKEIRVYTIYEYTRSGGLEKYTYKTEGEYEHAYVGFCEDVYATVRSINKYMAEVKYVSEVA